MNINALVCGGGVWGLSADSHKLVFHISWCGVARIHKYLSSYCLVISQHTSRLAFPQQMHWLDANHPSLSLPTSSYAVLQPDEVQCFCIHQWKTVVVLFHLMTEYCFLFQRHHDLVLFIRSTVAQSILLLWQVNHLQVLIRIKVIVAEFSFCQL